MPVFEQSQHKMFLEENIEVFRNSEDSEILIAKLSFYWNYLSPQHLTHIPGEDTFQEGGSSFECS